MEIKMGPIMGKAPATVGMLGVKEGDTVKAGHILAQIETGKGNRPIKAPSNGRIVKILCQEDSKVQAGQCLFEFEETDTAGDELEKIKTGLFIIGSGPGGYVAAIYAALCAGRKKAVRWNLLKLWLYSYKSADPDSREI